MNRPGGWLNEDEAEVERSGIKETIVAGTRTTGARGQFSGKLAVLAASVAMSVLSPMALGAADAPKDMELLRDYVHYVRIARYDLAQSNAQALLDRLVPPFGKTEADKGGLTLEAFVKLVEQGDMQRFEESITRGQRVGDVEEVSTKLQRAYEQGKREQARNAESITKNIQLLVGTSRQRLVGRERLMAAGEYAMPQMVEALVRNTDSALSAEVRKLMVDMGRFSVMPLTATIPNVDAKTQETIATILGDVRYKAALPFLYEAALNEKVNENVRKAAQNAIAKIDGAFDKNMEPSTLYTLLGESYASRQESLVNFPGEQMQLVWSYVPGSGLAATPVRSEIYFQTMAMRMAERAMSLNAGNRDATALWVASNLSREMSTPSEYQHPLYTQGYRDAMYYAVSAGPAIDQLVLARGLSTKDSALALKAIAALQRNGGASALSDAKQSRPLIDALRYANTRVQFEAALAFAGAQPQNTFEGSDRVVPILASAVRNAGTRYAAVISGNAEVANSIAGVLRADGFTVLPPGKSLGEIAEPLAAAPGIDLIVTSLPGTSTAEVITQARASSKLSATAVVAIMSPAGENELRSAFGRDQTVALVRQGSNPQQIAEATKQLLQRSAGEAISADEATAYQTRALTALRDLAIANSPVFNAGDAALPLIGALGNTKGKVREQVAEVLSRLNGKNAQMALADAALSAEGDEMMLMVAKLTDSAKRFGNLLEERQVSRITALAGKGSDEQATAIAGLIGALNLPNDSILPILKGGKQ